MGSGVGMPATLRLEAWALRVFDAFGHCPYHVGSSLRATLTGEGEWRDVDVRLILPDDEFDALFPNHNHRQPSLCDLRWALLCDALSGQAHQATGLPVDFQIQRLTEANAEFNGPRSALGIRITEG
jgi:hypothetical protein